jgi:DNA-binding response OmpR family regulator
VIAAFCPHCGFDLAASQPVLSGDWRVTPYSVELAGKGVRLTACENIILHSIISARGVPVTERVLAERIGYDGDNNNVHVMISRLRKSLPNVPIQTVRRAGYRWTDPVQEAA